MESNNVEDVLKTIISKAWEDEVFRKNLIANPKEVIENYTGAKVSIPEDKELVFVDQTDKTKVYVNIPHEPNMEDIELSEEQLEEVAGGGQIVWKQLIEELFPVFKNCIKV